MAEGSSSKVVSYDPKTINWELQNWYVDHKLLVAANASSSVVEFTNPRIALRYFLQPSEICRAKNTVDWDSSRYPEWYSLCAHILEGNSSCVVKVDTSGCKLKIDGIINSSKLKKGEKVVVIHDFIQVDNKYVDNRSTKGSLMAQDLLNLQQGLIRGGYTSAVAVRTSSKLTSQQGSLILSITTTISSLSQDNDSYSIEQVAANLPEPNSQMSLIGDLKTTLASSESYADLKLETRDNMTLSAHKLFLVARSQVFKKIVEEAVKKEGFDGTIKIADVDAKPMMVILHWVYTGELHENVARFLEEVMDASIKYKLIDLLKILDKELITFCNQENMFLLIQTARKYALPIAVENLSAFIKENL